DPGPTRARGPTNVTMDEMWTQWEARRRLRAPRTIPAGESRNARWPQRHIRRFAGVVLASHASYMVAMPTLSQSLATPTRVMQLSARLLPWIGGAACMLLAVGLYMSFTAPLDYQQGHAAKIMLVHVPAAWLSMFGYALLP